MDTMKLGALAWRVAAQPGQDSSYKPSILSCLTLKGAFDQHSNWREGLHLHLQKANG